VRRWRGALRLVSTEKCTRGRLGGGAGWSSLGRLSIKLRKGKLQWT
jgi:hypothetical protein